MTEPRPDRTVGASLVRQSLDELQKQIAAAPPNGTTVHAFAAYDKQTGAQVGVAVMWHGPKQSEWTLTGAFTRKAMASTSPYGVRFELMGKL